MRQAQAHVRSSMQPHMNSAEALKRMLTPALHATGMETPVYRFRLGERIITER